MRPAKTQFCLSIRQVWSESSLSAWWYLGFLATHWAHSDNWSDWAQSDLSLRWSHWPFVGFVMLWFIYKNISQACIITKVFLVKMIKKNNKSLFLFSLSFAKIISIKALWYKGGNYLNNYNTPPPANVMLVWGMLFSRCPSVFPSVRPSVWTFCFFLNILKRQWWKFIKLCRHIDIDNMYVYNRQLRARGQFCWSYCPL